MSDWISSFPGYKNVLSRAKMAFGALIRSGPVPQHVGIIMDGNRRYAKSKKIEMKEGHNMGFETMAQILELLFEAGVKAATVYAFSIENFKRSSYEVEWLMELAKSKLLHICQNGELCEQYGIRVKIIGNISLLPPDVLKVLRNTEEITKNNNRATLNVCFPYTSRDEMTHAIKKTVEQSILNSQLEISEETITNNLYTNDNPPLDLLIRTSGTYRLSDFLLWQCVDPKCAIVFIEKLWPDFRPWDMCKILLQWSYNKYWYGHGNGEVNNPNLGLLEDSNNANVKVLEIISGSGSTGYNRYDHDHDDIDEDSEHNSEFKSEEDETITSVEDERIIDNDLK
jgi:ditrans,polycis-polyprenyl diphosphate synthase